MKNLKKPANNRQLRKVTDEEWRRIPHCDNHYEISNYGRIKSFRGKKNKDGKFLKGSVLNGYRQTELKLFKDKPGKKFYNHKLVAEIWLERPSEKHVYVTHLDKKCLNNYYLNLKWHTKESLKEANREFYLKNPILARKRKANISKLTELDISHLKSMLERGVVQSKIAKLFSLSEMQVTRIKRGENWGYVKAFKNEEE